MLYRLAADTLVLLHLAFILLVLFGGLLVLKWRTALLVHLPALAWGLAVEGLHLECPLTDWENRMRFAAGDEEPLPLPADAHAAPVRQLLDAQGNPLARDGVFGDATRHAVEDMQRAEGLKVDGVVGPQSRAALQSHAHERGDGAPSKPADAAQESGSFVERMFNAARSGDGASVQKAITDFTSTLSQPWAQQAQEPAAQTQAQDAARNSGDPQR